MQSDDLLENAPLTACPSPFPRSAFNCAKSVQKIVNLQMHHVGHDLDFLSSSLADVISVDEFTKNLLQVYKDANRIGFSQELSFGLFRADYMLSEDDLQVKHVETNAIASGFACLGPKATQLHKFILSKYCPDHDVSSIPENNAHINFPNSFARAFDSYGNPKAILLVVTEDRTINLCDQRGLEFQIGRQRPDIRVVRRSWTSLHETAQFTEDRKFLVHGLEVALVYYRFCYDPSHFTSEKSWSLRLQIETSRAIKCPSIQYHLAGVKKLQQLLVDPQLAERFLSRGAVKELAQTYTGLYGLEMNERGDEALKMALERPDEFVLKPQREGGGNNLYGSDIVNVLNSIRNSHERKGYILMDIIRAPVNESILVIPGEGGTICNITSELGIYGSILASKNQVLFNEEDGHVLRSKKVGVNEGGVSAGFGVIDSPLLYST